MQIVVVHVVVVAQVIVAVDAQAVVVVHVLVTVLACDLEIVHLPMIETKKLKIYPTLCVTHKCNLNCIYCYQKYKSNANMSFETAKYCVDSICDTMLNDVEAVEFSFIGGEPLLNFDLIKKIFKYVIAKKLSIQKRFFITTNGTILTSEMKSWFTEHRDQFILCLSLDGTRETHNLNRSNSFDLIDKDFFLKNWCEQPIKMTLSENSLSTLAKDIRYLHSLGFKISGPNLAEGNFHYENKVDELKHQFLKLLDFYVEYDNVPLAGIFDKPLYICETEKAIHKPWCGIGVSTPFFDVDGNCYPCPFTTPMTFSKSDLKLICKTDFSSKQVYIDNYCSENCYLYSLCPTCAGANYLATGCFNKRDKSKCEILKLTALFSAMIQGKRILKGKQDMSDYKKYHSITAIKKIYETYKYLL